MHLNVHVKHISSSRKCAQGALRNNCHLVHNVLMKRTFLREWRKHKGMTLIQVADELHITNQQLGKIERGVQPYNQKLLEFLADLYGCDEADLIMRPPGASRDIRLVFDKIPENRRDEAIRLLQVLASTGTDG